MMNGLVLAPFSSSDRSKRFNTPRHSPVHALMAGCHLPIRIKYHSNPNVHRRHSIEEAIPGLSVLPKDTSTWKKAEPGIKLIVLLIEGRPALSPEPQSPHLPQLAPLEELKRHFTSFLFPTVFFSFFCQSMIKAERFLLHIHDHIWTHRLPFCGNNRIVHYEIIPGVSVHRAACQDLVQLKQHSPCGVS